MAWTTPRCWTTGEVVTAAIMNAHVRDNLNLTSAGVVTAAGDIAYASAAHTMARVAKGTNGNIIHQASCAPAWTACPSVAGITLSGALDANGTVDADVTDFDVLSSGDIDLVSSANAAAAIYIAQSTGTSGTVKIHADTGTSVTEGAESINILSDVGGIGIRSTANLANAINLTVDGGTTSSMTLFNDQGTSVTEGSASIEFLSDAGGVELRSTANLANAINLTVDGGTTSTMTLFNDQGTAVNEGVASIQLLSDVGGIGIKSGLNAAGAIRLTADAGTNETILIHADQGSGVGSICLTSDDGGITLNPATFVTVGGNATNAGEIRILEDTDNGSNYVAVKAPNVSTSYTMTLPTAVAGTCGFVLTSTTAGVTSWAAAAGGIASVAADTTPQLGGDLDAQNNDLLNVSNAGSDWTCGALTVCGGTNPTLTVKTTGACESANFVLHTNEGGGGHPRMFFKQGCGDGSANNMQYKLYYHSTGYFALQSADTDGSSTDACIFRIPDGQTTIDANTTWDNNVFDEHDDAMVLWRAFSPDGQQDLDAYALGKAALQTTKSELADMGVLKRYYKPCGDICETFLGYNDQRMAALLAGGIYQTRFTLDKNHECHEARLKALEARLNG